MTFLRSVLILCAGTACTAPASARSFIDTILNPQSAIRNPQSTRDSVLGSNASLEPSADYLECVPYARATSGIQLYGDAHTWWGQAQGRYATGTAPRVGAVMAIPSYASSKLGHVATVSQIVDARTIQLDHANWSVPGKIERNVIALDVSAGNDWSKVRIWYGPSRSLGGTHWPISGFIYNTKPSATPRLELARTQGQTSPSTSPTANVEPSPVRTATRKTRDPIGAIIAGNS